MEESRGASQELGMSVQRTQGCALKVRAAQAWRYKEPLSQTKMDSRWSLPLNA